MLQLIVIIALVGVVLWAINSYLPMDGKVKNILNIVVVLVLILWILNIFGVLSMIDVPITKIHT